MYDGTQGYSEREPKQPERYHVSPFDGWREPGLLLAVIVVLLYLLATK